MNEYIRPSFNMFPPVVKNLLIANAVVFLADYAVKLPGFPVNDLRSHLSWLLGLHYYSSQYFHFYQLFTYMFVHAGWEHIIFNMFGLWMFGNVLENFWGSKRFLIFYVICGIGAGLTQEVAQYFSFQSFNHAIEAFNSAPAYSVFNSLIDKYLVSAGYNASDLQLPALSDYLSQTQMTDILQQIYQFRADTWLSVGASGAIFGILLAFAIYFPNTELFLIFFPIPVKAKYFIILYGLWELYAGVANRPGDNVAHYAHLGGMLFGLILILYWKKQYWNGKRLY